jgi:MFS family permease
MVQKESSRITRGQRQGTGAATPWLMLALGVLAQAAGTVLLSTPAFLIPFLHTERGLDLASAGLLASAPTAGMVLTLVAWGALADRIGERWVIGGGTLLAALAAGGAVLVSGTARGSMVGDYLWLALFFLLGGMATASANAASGRLVVGWFPRNRRGLAMGVRQMSQPLGVAIAAVTIPSLVTTGGIAAAQMLSVVLCGALGLVCLVLLRDPDRAPRSAAEGASDSPYRSGARLWRIHAVSILLIVPQFTISTFGLVWLITEQSLSAAGAGLVVGVSQFVGALGRIAAGVLSDRVGSRMRPLRWVAITAVIVMVLLALCDQIAWPFAVAALIIATTVSVADNGLAFTAVAEIAGARWSGRALGIQNTGQYVAASVVGPVAGLLIGAIGYPLTFVAAAACALVAVPLVPSDHPEEHPTAHPDSSRARDFVSR